MKQEICKCGEYKGAHIDGLCPSAKDYGKKFEAQEVFPHEPKKTFGDYNQETGDIKCEEMGIIKPKNHSQQSKVGQSGMPKRSLGALTTAGTNAKPGGVKPTDFNLSEKIISGGLVFYIAKSDIKEFIKRDYKNLVLAKMGDISWQEYIRRRNKLAGGLGE